MDEFFQRFFEDLIGRVHGAMTFRLILQPTMAAIAALKDGVKDAKTGKPPYFFALFTDPQRRQELLRDGRKSVGRVFILGLVMDAIYQVWQLKTFYPGEAVVTAFILAIIPYVLLRGPVNLIARRFVRGKA